MSDEIKFLTNAQLESVLNIELKNVIAFDFFQAYPNILVIELVSGQFIRYDSEEFVGRILELFPYPFCGFWEYPMSIITMNELDTNKVSSCRYLPITE